jgi:hypothetical protein
MAKAKSKKSSQTTSALQIRRGAFVGKQGEWLDDKCAEFKITGDTGAFYTRTTHEFLEEFTYAYAPGDTINPDTLTSDEKQTIFSDLRAVSSALME